jgi:tRNA threonylcarbamoyl adenosine modification protein (Sua5/YciO/YrdC/YwlC family)
MTARDHAVAAEALAEGGVAIVATDTVYGLVALPSQPGAVARIYDLKERPRSMPLALLAADVEGLFAALPGLDRRARAAIEHVMPGPYTLVVTASGPLPAALGGGTAGTVGVRVPVLPSCARALIARTGPLASTSANRHGAPDAASVDEIPDDLVSSVDAVLDDGRLPGTPSTVVELTGTQPRVLREGAVSSALALAALEGEAP